MSNGIMCTTTMCANAKVQLAQMQETYKNYANDGAFVARFKPSVDSIQQAFDDNYSVFSEWIPFNPTCCALQDIGNQAEDMNNQMLSYVGAAPITPTPKPMDINSLLLVGGVIVGLIVLAPYIPRR